uniref:Uncharacterized protein n=1 Tax=Chromera velia CCMP2878 TaxID=1169474 RepID=A0A0G4HSR0_9ALVE|eukprot:Cvel_8314.t1-p1 / transcript=Cvel_8314.t1 / gene=Cvel_8314 / organism=Chromera_velia_CCMP2878 / gene_product=hypothetical protein / transcript_product=hypothetical protein / location=Cvel_scaffold456:70700-74154(+) / protein_length=733 / sequence_SO=supercontig / SO=protein_coding / is_pseudo=false
MHSSRAVPSPSNKGIPSTYEPCLKNQSPACLQKRALVMSDRDGSGNVVISSEVIPTLQDYCAAQSLSSNVTRVQHVRIPHNSSLCPAFAQHTPPEAVCVLHCYRCRHCCSAAPQPNSIPAATFQTPNPYTTTKPSKPTIPQFNPESRSAMQSAASRVHSLNSSPPMKPYKSATAVYPPSQPGPSKTISKFHPATKYMQRTSPETRPESRPATSSPNVFCQRDDLLDGLELQRLAASRRKCHSKNGMAALHSSGLERTMALHTSGHRANTSGQRQGGLVREYFRSLREENAPRGRKGGARKADVPPYRGTSDPHSLQISVEWQSESPPVRGRDRETKQRRGKGEKEKEKESSRSDPLSPQEDSGGPPEAASRQQEGDLGASSLLSLSLSLALSLSTLCVQLAQQQQQQNENKRERQTDEGRVLAVAAAAAESIRAHSPWREGEGDSAALLQTLESVLASLSTLMPQLGAVPLVTQQLGTLEETARRLRDLLASRNPLPHPPSNETASVSSLPPPPPGPLVTTEGVLRETELEEETPCEGAGPQSAFHKLELTVQHQSKQQAGECESGSEARLPRSLAEVQRALEGEALRQRGGHRLRRQSEAHSAISLEGVSASPAPPQVIAFRRVPAEHAAPGPAPVSALPAAVSVQIPAGVLSAAPGPPDSFMEGSSPWRRQQKEREARQRRRSSVFSILSMDPEDYFGLPRAKTPSEASSGSWGQLNRVLHSRKEEVMPRW